MMTMREAMQHIDRINALPTDTERQAESQRVFGKDWITMTELPDGAA